MTTYTSEPGTRLGGRYRLEDRIAAGAGWAAWKAIDEILARAVTVFTLAPGFPRIGEVMTAARAASRLTDPRLAQVFDVEDAQDHAYVVMEWAAGETLGDMLSHGPVEPTRAARLIAEAAAAIASAHAAGIAHMCLSPGSLRLSQTGEIKVVGLGIDAALSGATADDPVLADTMGLGRLLYAALTATWPGQDYPSLRLAPAAGGEPYSPRQVVAGIPALLSDLACRAMGLRGAPEGPPIGSPEQLARALIAAIPPAPVPAEWQAGRGRADGSQRHGQPASASGERDARAEAPGRQAALAPGELPELPSRAGGRGSHRAEQSRVRGGTAGLGRVLPGARPRAAVIAGVGAVALAAVAAFTFWPGGGSTPAGHASGPPRPRASVTVLTPAGAAGFDPLNPSDRNQENSQWARYAIDANPRTAWTSQYYRTARFGNLKRGSGLIIDMGRKVTFTSVTVTFGPVPGAHVRLLVGDSGAHTAANLASMREIASAVSPTGSYTFTIRHPADGRFLVIWFTRLPRKPGPGHWYMAEIFNVAIKGTAP